MENVHLMRFCLSCQQPILTIHEHHRERRRDRVSHGIIWLLILITGSLGYLLRDGVFLKRENSSLWKLVNAYVGKVEVDKLVSENTALKGKVRGQH